MDNENNIIGKSIKQNRLERGVTQTALAKAIGVTHAAISFWENGVNIPNISDCWKMAEYMHITIDELVGKE